MRISIRIYISSTVALWASITSAQVGTRAEDTSPRIKIVDGVEVLNSPAVVDVDELIFRDGSQLIANGNPLKISVHKLLAIEGEARISSLGDFDKQKCVGQIFPSPAPGTNGNSYAPGPNAPDMASRGTPGLSGGTGGEGRSGMLGAACAPIDASNLLLTVVGTARGRLNIDLSGGTGASGNPSSQGGKGGRGQQGGRCPPGVTGWVGGIGGTGGMGGPSQQNPYSSGKGGDLTISMNGDTSAFELVRVDVGPGEHGDPGVSGLGGWGGPGGNGGRGGPGCAGLENYTNLSGFDGARGATPFGAIGSIGSSGTITLSGIDYWGPDVDCGGDPTEPDAQVSKRAIRDFWEINAVQLFGTSLMDVPSSDPAAPAHVIQNASIAKLFALPIEDPIRGSLDNQVFLNLVEPYVTPAPNSTCGNQFETDFFACCNTPTVAGAVVQSPFVECLLRFSTIYQSRPRPLDRALFFLILGRVVARELSKDAIVLPESDFEKGNLQPDATYIRIAGSAQDGLWPNGLVLLIRIQPSTFERITGIFTRLSRAITKVLGVSIVEDPFIPSPPALGLFCSANLLTPVSIGSSDTTLPKPGFSTLQVSSGANIEFYRPATYPPVNPRQVHLSMWSYRGKSAIMAQFDSWGAPDPGTAAQTCRFAGETLWRQDSFAGCAALPVDFNALSGDYLKVRELRSVIYNYIYIALMGKLISTYINL